MSKEIVDLMEAYNAVYASKELIEEQVEEVVEEVEQLDENWQAKLLGAAAKGLRAASAGAKPVLKTAATKSGKYGAIGLGALTADELLTRGAGRTAVGKGLEQTRKLGPALRGEPEETSSAKVQPSSSDTPGQATGKVVAAAGGKGGTVTSGTKYAATLGGKKGNVTYDDAGKKTFTADSYEYDAYDLVLEYLLSQGHAETVEEAHYVMMEMDAETIGSIVEGVMPELIDPTAHNKSQRFATQQGKIRALESGAATPGEKSAAQSKLKGPQLPGV